MPQVSLAPWQFAALYQPFDHFAFYAGIGAGKTYTGSHFAINQINHYPERTGLIGANNYDQLSQATLRELFYWLDYYGYDYVIDRIPPYIWGGKRELKSYKNVLSIRNPKTEKVSTVFIRVLSDADPLRGIEISWYWLDETRDTPEYTHDVILGRMRETPGYMKGIITTTTNGEDWSYKRFVLGAKRGDYTYGSMHVPTLAAVDAGILTRQYYTTLTKSYSPLMALQELEAKHVNILGGKAYYAASDKNRRRIAPWGDSVPNRERPLVIGCDFNFNPAPCVWMVGQVGPAIWSSDGKTFYGDCIHWFGQISDTNIGTVEMTYKLLMQYPDFFYQIFGDCSGGQGTTSNAGVTDYNQISETMMEAAAMFSIDYFEADTHQNPKVRSRVENMNARFCNAMGEVRQTYDPVNCPLFDGDIKMVGWKRNIQSGRGKLDDGGDCTRTHATDGAGYAVYKLFPPIVYSSVVPSVRSEALHDIGINNNPLKSVIESL
jgi:hypothetical protein